MKKCGGKDPTPYVRLDPTGCDYGFRYAGCSRNKCVSKETGEKLNRMVRKGEMLPLVV